MSKVTMWISSALLLVLVLSLTSCGTAFAVDSDSDSEHSSTAVRPEMSQPGQVPRQAVQYQRDLIRYSRHIWGRDAPIALFAAQIHQESSWRHDARSPYASGLTQFTDDTAEWIAGLYPTLGQSDTLNPRWAIQAMVHYNVWLHNRHEFAADQCERFAFNLSGYNGGPGWIPRDRKLAQENGADDTRWWGSVEHHTNRRADAKHENRTYPKRIIFELQPTYHSWGSGGLQLICEVIDVRPTENIPSRGFDSRDTGRGMDAGQGSQESADSADRDSVRTDKEGGESTGSSEACGFFCRFFKAIGIRI